MSGLTLLCVHGYPLDRRMWGPLAGRLERGGGLRVAASDLRGRGASKRPPADVHAMSLFADDLAADLPSLVPGDGPFLLCGLSMGGYVAFEFLRRHGARLRGRLRGLVLCDTRATGDDAAGRAKRKDASEAIRRSGIGAAFEAMAPKLLSPASKGTAAEALVRDMILATPPATAMADLAGLALRSDAFDVLGSFDRPVLVVCGEDDAITPAADAEAMAAAATSAPFVRLFTVPGAGHMAPLERPDDVADAIEALISRLPGSA
ncbi:MAG TPA: alpha/beta fold hydrolase [Thermoanaerobaculia bacterium]|nr:alpha/beta fold hydrolase [Thermoanaerobaculia bacterium]